MCSKILNATLIVVRGKKIGRCIIQTDIKGEIDQNTEILENLTPHSHQWTDLPDRKFIRKHWS